MIRQFFSLSFILTLALVGCAHGNCNNVPQRPEKATEGTPPTVQEQANTSTATPTSAPMKLPKDAIQISKPTGEKQCGMEKGVTLEEMQTSLTQAKIKVYEGHTQLDGLMHMALCGSASGSIHVFSISKKDFKKAKKLGFKLFKSSTLN